MTREQYIENIKERLNGLTKDELKDVSILTSAQLGVRQKLAEKERIENEITNSKSRLDSQQPEIPEFVATEIEEKNRRFSNFHKTANIESYVKEVRDWYYEKPYHAELFYRAILDGYTVAKENRFYLKDNRELESVGNTCIGYVTLYLKNEGYLTTDKTRAGKFTQQEIDSMAAESYEQIEVEEEV